MPSAAQIKATSSAGIITAETGERIIPESVRPDGTLRKAIKIKPGYLPPEDVEVYKNRTAEGFRNRGKGPVLGAEAVTGGSGTTPALSAAANKNAKKREAKKRAKAATGGGGDGADEGQDEEDTVVESARSETNVADEEKKIDPNGSGPTDAEAEKEKKARGLKKKIKQAKDLKDKRESGQTLLPEQLLKVVKIDELIRELNGLGFDAD